LLRVGFRDPRAPAFFFIARIVLAVVLAAAAFVLAPSLVGDRATLLWLLVWLGGLLGYFLPNIYLNRRITSRQIEHQAGFPDFMDLLVVSADAGLSVEAALDPVGRELGDFYPSLSTKIYMTTPELRARPPPPAAPHPFPHP